jgi:predicted nucleotide-binding protein (sugar kinase/HSP70/actin superfamily)
MKITFPHMGDGAIAFKVFFEHFGYEVILPPPTTHATIERGLRVSPETMCFPFKVALGNLMAAIDMGADTVGMFDTRGQCRFRYYNMLYRKLLSEQGYDVQFVVFTPWDGIKLFLRRDGIPLSRKIRGSRLTWRKLAVIDATDELARRYRPRERERGATNRLRAALVREVDAGNDFQALGHLRDELDARFEEIGIDADMQPLRVGLVGEVYTVIEPYLNQHIDVVLGALGAEVHTTLQLSEMVSHCWPHKRLQVRRKARRYLRSGVGGHGVYTVANTRDYAVQGFDGVVHVAPFGCMPETTVRPILSRIARETDMPVLSLTFDEHTNRQGLQTRLEAFIDLLRMRRGRGGTERATVPRRS